MMCYFDLLCIIHIMSLPIHRVLSIRKFESNFQTVILGKIDKDFRRWISVNRPDYSIKNPLIMDKL